MKNIILVALVALFVGFVFGATFMQVEFVNGATGFVTTVQEPPADRVGEDQIRVLQDKVIIDVQNVQWASFADSKSMHPFLFPGANALQLTPDSPDDIQIGDVITYVDSLDPNRFVIHRVVYVSEDNQGWYCIVKGDHNVVSDPGKIRFEQIDRVLIGVIY